MFGLLTFIEVTQPRKRGQSPSQLIHFRPGAVEQASGVTVQLVVVAAPIALDVPTVAVHDRSCANPAGLPPEAALDPRADLPPLLIAKCDETKIVLATGRKSSCLSTATLSSSPTSFSVTYTPECTCFELIHPCKDSVAAE